MNTIDNNNRLIELLNNNKDSSNELSLLLIQYLTFKNKFNSKDLSILLPKEDYINLLKEEKKELLQQFLTLKKTSIIERKSYIDFILLNIKKNILNVKLYQQGLSNKDLENIQKQKDNTDNEINNYKFELFGLDKINKLVDFIELLDNCETIFNSLYRNEKFFFTDENFVSLVNDTDLTNINNLTKLMNKYFNDNIMLFIDQIEELLFEAILKKIENGFSKKTYSQSKDTFFDILGKVLSKEVKALNIFTKGINLAI